MKILHSNLNPCADNCIGVINQMYSELKAAEDLNLNYTVKFFTTGLTSSLLRQEYQDLLHFYTPKGKHRISTRLEFRIAYYKWLKKMEKEVDCFVLRYIPADPFQYFFIRNSRKPVCLIHHTKETNEILTRSSLKSYVKYAIEYFIGRKSIKSCYITSAVTNEIIEYELNRAAIKYKPVILKPNGIKVNNTILNDRRSGDIPVLLFVASYFYDWHGLDILIKAIKATDKKVKIHLVGEVRNEDLMEISNDDRFIIHGKLKESDIATISEECWVSIGSLAMFRNNLKEGSTLKVRSYLSMGLPVYSGYIESFSEDFKFYKYIDNNIDIESLITFCHETRNYSKDYIRDQSAKFISIDVIVNKFYSDIQQAITS